MSSNSSSTNSGQDSTGAKQGWDGLSYETTRSATNDQGFDETFLWWYLFDFSPYHSPTTQDPHHSLPCHSYPVKNISPLPYRLNAEWLMLTWFSNHYCNRDHGAGQEPSYHYSNRYDTLTPPSIHACNYGHSALWM